MLSQRLNQIAFSGIRKVAEQVHAIESAGREVHNLLLGEPDFTTPDVIIEAVHDALAKGDTHYQTNYGKQQLRQAIAAKLRRENNMKANADEILLTVGAAEAIFLSMMALLDEGDEVLIPGPTWMNYAESARLAGGEPIIIPLDEKAGTFSLSVEVLEQYCTNKTKLLVLTSPANPTGMVLDRQSLLEIAAFAKKHNLIVIADEIYEKIIYDEQHISIATLPDMADRTITINGFSKAYAMTGWRIGYLHAPLALMNGIIRVHQFNVSSLPGFTQHAAKIALESAEEYVISMRNAFLQRRNIVIDILNQSPYLSVVPPKGAIYLFLNISASRLSSSEFSTQLLKQKGVAVVPGDVFSSFGEGYVRLSFAADEKVLEKACKKIVEFMQAVCEKEHHHVGKG